MANVYPQIIVYDPTNVGLAPMLGNTQTWTGVNTFSQNIVGNLTGTVTGSSSLNVLKAGDTMTGALNITGSSNVIQLKVKANATQTTNIQEWQSSSGVVLASLDGTGTFCPTSVCAVSFNDEPIFINDDQVFL